MNGNCIDIINIKVHQRSGSGVTFMFGQVHGNVTTTEEQVERHPGRKSVFAFDLESEASVPFCGFLTVFGVKDWD